MNTNKADITIANVAFCRKDEKGKSDNYIPLGPLYLTAVLEKNGYLVDFRDYQTYSTRRFSVFDEQLDIKNFVSFLKSSSTITGLSCTSDLLPFVILGVEEFKKQNPEKIIILGGIGATGVGEEILKNFPFIDIIVKGEGELTLLELMDNFGKKDLKYIPGIAFRNGDKIYNNPPRKRIENLDILPLPAYYKIDFKEYENIGIVASRGCPFKCAFCGSTTFWGYRYIQRNVDKVIEEIRMIYNTYNKRFFQFYDDLFFLDKRSIIEFCKRLIENKLEIEWNCSIRAELIDEDLMKEMSRAGCNGVFFGVESGSDKVLQHLKKKVNLEHAKAIISQAVKYFKDVTVSFMWGFPFETMADFYATLDYVKWTIKSGATPWFFMACPFPLSQIYSEYKDNIKFSSELCSNIIDTERTKNVIELIKKYPNIFSPFYYYDSRDIYRKFTIAKEYAAPLERQSS